MTTCRCSYYKTKYYGLRPANHHSSCPEFISPEVSPYSEVWLREEDKIKHDKSVIIRREAIKNGKENKSHSKK